MTDLNMSEMLRGENFRSQIDRVRIQASQRIEGFTYTPRRVFDRIAEVGCAGCGCLTLGGLILAFAGTAFAVSATVHIPFTEANIIGSGAIGNKDSIESAQPAYVEQKTKASDFLNHSSELSFWLFREVEELRIGEEIQAPPFDFNIRLSPRQ